MSCGSWLWYWVERSCKCKRRRDRGPWVRLRLSGLWARQESSRSCRRAVASRICAGSLWRWSRPPICARPRPFACVSSPRRLHARLARPGCAARRRPSRCSALAFGWADSWGSRGTRWSGSMGTYLLGMRRDKKWFSFIYITLIAVSLNFVIVYLSFSIDWLRHLKQWLISSFLK